MGGVWKHWHRASALVGRLSIATLFVHEGYAKLANYTGAVRYAESFGVPGWLLPGAIVIEVGCGLMLIAGIYARLVAMVLAAFCLMTALLFHAKFSEVNQLLHFEKNLAIAGGLLLFALFSTSPRAG